MVYTEEELWVGRTVWLWILSAVMERNVEEIKHKHTTKKDKRAKQVTSNTNTCAHRQTLRDDMGGGGG